MAVDTLRQSSIATISIAFGRWPPHFEPMNPFWTRKSTCCCSMFPLFLLCAACWCVGAGGFLFFSFVTDIFCRHCSLPVVDMELTTAHWVLCGAQSCSTQTSTWNITDTSPPRLPAAARRSSGALADTAADEIYGGVGCSRWHLCASVEEEGLRWCR